MNGPPTLGDWVDRAAARLESAGIPDPRREARGLACRALEIDPGLLVTRWRESVDAADLPRLDDWLARRGRREPFQYITGREEFHGIVLAVDGRVLVPRPETEGLVDVCLELTLPRGARVLDAGTGSGCIALALARARPDLEIDAVDRSESAVAAAKENAERLGPGRIRFTVGDFGALEPGWAGRFDLVVSNPPYVSEREWAGLQPEVRDHEPKSALVSGPSGEEAYARLVPESARVLVDGGWLALELGYRSAEAVMRIARAAGFADLRLVDDLSGIPRVLVGRLAERA